MIFFNNIRTIFFDYDGCQRGNPADHHDIFSIARKPIVKPECETGDSIPIFDDIEVDAI